MFKWIKGLWSKKEENVIPTVSCGITVEMFLSLDREFVIRCTEEMFFKDIYTIESFLKYNFNVLDNLDLLSHIVVGVKSSDKNLISMAYPITSSIDEETIFRQLTYREIFEMALYGHYIDGNINDVKAKFHVINILCIYDTFLNDNELIKGNHTKSRIDIDGKKVLELSKRDKVNSKSMVNSTIYLTTDKGSMSFMLESWIRPIDTNKG